MQRNKCTSIRRKAIRDFFVKKSEAKNPREFWNVYRPFLHSKRSKQVNDIILKENDVTLTEKKEIGNLLNDYFVDIADGLCEIDNWDFGDDFCTHPSINAIHNNNGKKREEDYFNFNLTNKKQIEQLLLNINTRKSCGHDLISPRLLKDSASAISEAVAKIINASISQCKYPCRWKMGQVTPLFKKDDELVKENYRPVTVLPCLNNIFERLLSSQLNDFLYELPI